MSKYRALVGSLMGLSVMTRSDIANALCACARHRHNPMPRHWKALLHVTAYVYECDERDWFEVCSGSGFRLCTYADADTQRRLTI